MKRWLKRVPVLFALVAVAALYASGSAGANTTQKAAIILGSGSDTSQNVMMALDSAYNFAPGCDNLSTPPILDGSCNVTPPAGLVNPWHDTIAERYAIGSSNGINQLCQQGQTGIASVNFARSSRVPKSSDCTGLHFVEFAQDAVTWEAFPGVSGSGATQLFSTGGGSLLISDLTNIFENCSVTDWSQVGGGAGAITIYVPQAGSGTLGTFAAAVGTSSSDNLEECIPSGDPNPGNPGSHKILENENAAIIANGDQKNAIFPFSVGVYHAAINHNSTFLSQNATDGSRLGAINGKLPTTTNVNNGTFPIVRPLANVYCAAAGGCGTASQASSSVTNYIGEQGFLCKKSIQTATTPKKNWVDPATGTVYRTPTAIGATPKGEIPSIISKWGFIPFVAQSDGTFCVTVTT
jgi:phosphate transport system substrate-binding protein